jgi:transcriptional regulator with XRE-family HTH domain
MSIGENLKRLRRDKGWTQGDLADKCDIRLGQISKIERNGTDPKLSTIYSLMNALECSPNALLSDISQENLDSRMAIILERVQKLSDKDKSTLLSVIDKYCIAISMQELLDDKNSFLGLQRFMGKTEEMNAGIND